MTKIEKLELSLFIVLILSLFGPLVAISGDISRANDELPTCQIGTSDDSECVLDANDCSRGIDESNQESCS